MHHEKTIIKWQNIITNWKQSGMKQIQYCKHKKIDISTFSKWKKYFNSSEYPLLSTDSDTSFVKLNKINQEVQKLTIMVGHSVRIEIDNNTPLSLLKQVLNILEA